MIVAETVPPQSTTVPLVCKWTRDVTPSSHNNADDYSCHVPFSALLRGGNRASGFGDNFVGVCYLGSPLERDGGSTQTMDSNSRLPVAWDVGVDEGSAGCGEGKCCEEEELHPVPERSQMMTSQTHMAQC